MLVPQTITIDQLPKIHFCGNPQNALAQQMIQKSLYFFYYKQIKK